MAIGESPMPNVEKTHLRVRFFYALSCVCQKKADKYL